MINDGWSVSYAKAKSGFYTKNNIDDVAVILKSEEYKALNEKYKQNLIRKRTCRANL